MNVFQWNSIKGEKHTHTQKKATLKTSRDYLWRREYSNIVANKWLIGGAGTASAENDNLIKRALMYYSVNV